MPVWPSSFPLRLDNAEKQFSLLSGSANDPTSFNVFPTAVDHTAFMGTADRTGRDTFDSRALAYSRDDFQWIGTIAVAGAWTLSEDCTTASVTWNAGAFFPGETIPSTAFRSSASRKSTASITAFRLSPPQVKSSHG